jgi:hypothetical protein
MQEERSTTFSQLCRLKVDLSMCIAEGGCLPLPHRFKKITNPVLLNQTISDSASWQCRLQWTRRRRQGGGGGSVGDTEWRRGG